MKYAPIERFCQCYAVRLMCRVMGVSASGYDLEKPDFLESQSELEADLKQHSILSVIPTHTQLRIMYIMLNVTHCVF